MAYTSAPLAKGRIFAFLILLALGSTSIYFGVAAWRWNSNFYRWVDAKPMQMTIDLTTPATHAAPFEQTCAIAHSQSIYVTLNDPDITDENVGEYFAGLQGSVTIRDLSGTEILTTPFHADGMQRWSDDPLLVSFHPFANGDYTAELNIEQGATMLADTQHDLYARYDLCGLELMPAYILGAISAAAGLIACGVASVTLPSIARHGFRVQMPDDDRLS